MDELTSQLATITSMDDTTNSKAQQLEAIFLPFPTAGHMNPMVDIARLFTAHGVHVTVVTTPFSVPTFSTSNNKITLHILKLPAEEFPQSNPLSFSAMPTLVQFMKKLRPQIEQVVMEKRAHCIVSDMFFPWTADMAMSFRIPRLVFHGTSCYSLCCLHSDKTQLMKSEFPATHELVVLLNEIRDADTKSQGVLVNSFFELEGSYFDIYAKSVGVKAWHIGPLHLNIDRAARGTDEAWLDWLNSQMPNSVLFISFGSMTELNTAQLVELASGLEASERPFIWVLKQIDSSLLEGFEERMKETRKGLILKSWAPQTLILSHPAIGGFLTHCGWNSIIESITAGVPMITWPFAADQFINENLVTEVIKVGVKVGVEEQLELKKALGYLVTRVKVEKAVTQLMCSNEQAEERRMRARELGKMAKKVVEKDGSSFGSIVCLVDGLKATQLCK